MRAFSPVFLLLLSLAGCKFYTSLLGYPTSAKPSDFRYYDANFKENNSVELAKSRIKFQGFYVNHDTASFIYNDYEGKKLIHKRAIHYRYFKFFDDGSIVHASVSNKPDSTTNKWLNNKPWFITGRFKLKDDTAYVEMKNELNGNKSYFYKVIIYTDSLHELNTDLQNKISHLDYQHQLK